MSITRGYFMSDEAEKAAKFEILERHAKAKSRLAALEDQMSQKGQELTRFAETLKSPSQHAFSVVRNLNIAVQRKSQSTKVAELWKQTMDWDALCELIDDYEQTKRDLSELDGRVQALGIPH
jgi:hypothetical protein